MTTTDKEGRQFASCVEHRIDAMIENLETVRRQLGRNKLGAAYNTAYDVSNDAESLLDMLEDRKALQG